MDEWHRRADLRRAEANRWTRQRWNFGAPRQPARRWRNFEDVAAAATQAANIVEKIKQATDPAAEPWPPMRAGEGL
jgi:hypothetical protein